MTDTPDRQPDATEKCPKCTLADRAVFEVFEETTRQPLVYMEPCNVCGDADRIAEAIDVIAREIEKALDREDT